MQLRLCCARSYLGQHGSAQGTGPCGAMDKIWAGHGKVSLSGSKSFDWQIHLTASQPWSQHQFGVIPLMPSKDVQPQRMKFYKRWFTFGP